MHRAIQDLADKQATAKGSKASTRLFTFFEIFFFFRPTDRGRRGGRGVSVRPFFFFLCSLEGTQKKT